MILTITCSSPPNQLTLDPIADRHINLTALGQNFVLTLLKTTPTSITLKVSGLSLKIGDQLTKPGINLLDRGEKKFTLKVGEIAKLFTCTTDITVSWTLALT